MQAVIIGNSHLTWRLKKILKSPWKLVMKNSVLALEAPKPKSNLCFTVSFKVLKNGSVLYTTKQVDKGFWLRFRSSLLASGIYLNRG